MKNFFKKIQSAPFLNTRIIIYFLNFTVFPCRKEMPLDTNLCSKRDKISIDLHVIHTFILELERDKFGKKSCNGHI